MAKAMSTGEISCILSRIFAALSKHTTNAPVFKGVFAADEIPYSELKDSPSPLCLVLNSDPSSQPGTHWICAFILPDSSSVEFFDSYGLAPTVYNFSFPPSTTIFNTLTFQSPHTPVCGQYCILYLSFRAFPHLLSHFTPTLRTRSSSSASVPDPMRKILNYFEALGKTNKSRDSKIALHINTLNQIFPCFCNPLLKHSSCILNQCKTFQFSHCKGDE